MTADDRPTREELELALAVQETLRASLGDAIVDATIAALRAQLDRMESASRAGPRRRLATVMFVDVVDSTGLLQDRDPEETMAIMDSALERLAGPVGAHGGRVTRFMGDGYLAVFGLPVSRENDPEMAIRAGLAIQSEAAAISRDLRIRHGLEPFSARVGINTGLVVSGGSTEAEDTIMGAEVNLAARLEAAAPPGGILISHGTLQHVRGRCVVEDRGELEAKGFPSPVPVYLVLGMSDETERSRRVVIEGIEIPMIGRDAEMAALSDALTGARTTGKLRVIALSGRPGMGKSRLAREFEESLPATTRSFRARSGPEDRDTPYALPRDLLTRCLDLRIGDSTEELRLKLVAGLAGDTDADAEDRATLIGRLAGFDLGDAGDEPQRLRSRALRQLADFLAPDRGQTVSVLVLEDLQWADEASLEAVRVLTELLAEVPILIVASARPEFWTEGSAPELDRHRLDLGPLDERAAAQLIDAVLAQVDGDTFALRRLLLARAEGNPQVLEEILRMLVDDAVLVRSGSGWRVAERGLTDLRLPPTLLGIVQARLDALDAAERTVLQRASVVGRVFWEGAVARVGGDQPVAGFLDALVRRDMIMAREASAFPATSEYAFRHSMLREVAYESVLLEDRKALHGLVADWLLEQVSERTTEMAGVIGTHLERAGRGDEALEFLIRAAEAARSGYAVAAAADFYDRALALVTPDDLARRYELLLGRQDMWGLQGDRPSQQRVLEELEVVAEELGEPEKQALVAVERTWLAFYVSDFQGALAAATQAAEFAAASGDPVLESRTRSALAWAFLSLDDLDRAGRDGHLALSLAEQGGHLKYQAAAHNTLAMVSLARGDLSEGSAHLEAALGLIRGESDVGAETTYLSNLGVARTLVGDFEGARQRFGETFDLAEAGGDLTGIGSAYTNLAWVAASRGEWEEACDLARRALPMKRRQGHREAEAEALLWLGHALTGLGRLDEALETYRPSLAIREELDQTALALGVRAGMARAHLAAGDHAAALAQVERVLEHIEGGGSLDGTWEPLRIHLTCVEVLGATGDERRDRVLERAASILEERSVRVTDAADRRLLLEAVPWHRRILELAGRGGG